MKTIILTIILTLSCIYGANAKKGIVVAHYGSSNDRTRALTIDKITAEITESVNPEVPVKEAYISPVVRKNLAHKE